MAKQKRVDQTAADSSSPADRPRAAVAVPRAWLAAITILLVVPWLVAAGMYLFRTREVPSVATPVAAGAAKNGTPGPWGRLVLTPIVIAPPLEYVSRNWGPSGPTLWHIPVANPGEVAPFLSATGFAADDIARLQATARRHSGTGGMVLAPEPDLVRRLAPEVRARLYLRIVRSRLNVDQQTAFRFHGSSLETWLGPLVSARTRELVAPYVYRQGDFMYFADIESVRTQIEDPEELQRLAKVLYRQSTMLVELRLDRQTEVGALAEYWGRGGRRTDVRPLLESMAESGPDRTIDISHLLPSLARDHLYRYPRITVADHEKPLLANCLWTALNFFSTTPDERLLDVQVALARLKSDYYLVQDGFQLGDVVAFADREGNLFHVAVYIADGLVFGKNGITPMAPWSILPIERIKGHYVEDSEDWQVTYHRKNGL
jgi:hypothetical protein